METFETSSINDSAFVLVTISNRLRGVTYTGHKCVMTFLSVDGDVEEAVAAFPSGASCNAREYARQLSWLRSRVKETSNNTRPPATPLPRSTLKVPRRFMETEVHAAANLNYYRSNRFATVPVLNKQVTLTPELVDAPMEGEDGFRRPLAKFRTDIERYGLVGEVINAQIVFLAAVSSQLPDPLNVTMFAESSAGKNNLMEKSTAFLPDEWKRPITGMSAKVMMHSEKDEWRHKAILIAELEGVTGADYGIRTMQSEKKIVWEFVDSSGDGIKKRRNEVDGPAAFIQATTQLRVHAENETRQLSVHLDESPEQTRAINYRQAMQSAGLLSPFPHSEVMKWHEFMLTLKENRVVVPYALDLHKAFPADRLRSRRDFPRLMSLIHVSAYLHQHDRKRDPQGRIIADPADYAEVKPLFTACFATKLEKSTRDVMRFLSRFALGYSFKVNEVMKWASVNRAEGITFLTT